MQDAETWTKPSSKNLIVIFCYSGTDAILRNCRGLWDTIIRGQRTLMMHIYCPCSRWEKQGVLQLMCPVILAVTIKRQVLHLWKHLSWAQEELSTFWLRWKSALYLPKWRSRSWSGWLTVVRYVPESPSGSMRSGRCSAPTCLYLFTQKIWLPKLTNAFQEFCPNSFLQWVSSRGMNRAQGSSSFLDPCTNHQDHLLFYPGPEWRCENTTGTILFIFLSSFPLRSADSGGLVFG